MQKVMTTLALVAGFALVPVAPAVAGECGGHPSRTAQLTRASHPVTVRSNIVEVAQSAGQFGTLLAAAQAAGLADDLAGPGPLTVFAPTDAAFAALPQGTVQRLLRPENRHELIDVLKLHVVSGRVAAGDLLGQVRTVQTLGGQLLVDGSDGVRVGRAQVIMPDVQASNGIVHVIDRVLLP